jgi:hypothetical protein
MQVRIVLRRGSLIEARVERAIEQIHRLQTHFRLSLSPTAWLPSSPKSESFEEPESFKRLLERRVRDKPVIAVTESGIGRRKNLFVAEYGEVSVITVGDWDRSYAPPSMETFLVFQFASSLLNFAAGLTDDILSSWPHDPPVGCFLDRYPNYLEMRRCMVAATICSVCESRLFEMRLPAPALEAIEALLSHVRRAVIRRGTETPKHIFIGHGHSKEWLALRDYLRALGMEVDEFNIKPVVGIATSARIEEMLEGAAAAFLVLTAETRAQDGKWYPRSNVFHEIGLFQGKLGLRKTIILREHKAESCSNLDGVTEIRFGRGDFAGSRQVRKKIRETLEREGLLPGWAARQVSKSDEHKS